MNIPSGPWPSIHPVIPLAHQNISYVKFHIKSVALGASFHHQGIHILKQENNNVLSSVSSIVVLTWNHVMPLPTLRLRQNQLVEVESCEGLKWLWQCVYING